MSDVSFFEEILITSQHTTEATYRSNTADRSSVKTDRRNDVWSRCGLPRVGVDWPSSDRTTTLVRVFSEWDLTMLQNRNSFGTKPWWRIKKTRLMICTSVFCISRKGYYWKIGILRWQAQNTAGHSIRIVKVWIDIQSRCHNTTKRKSNPW